MIYIFDWYKCRKYCAFIQNFGGGYNSSVGVYPFLPVCGVTINVRLKQEIEKRKDFCAMVLNTLMKEDPIACLL